MSLYLYLGENTVFNLGGDPDDDVDEDNMPPVSGLRRQISETSSTEGNIFSESTEND